MPGEEEEEGSPVAYGSAFASVCGGGVWTSWSTRGRRVTMPEPRGRKSLPTMLSEREEMRETDVQEDCHNQSVSCLASLADVPLSSTMLHSRLQDTTLSRALRSHDYALWQVHGLSTNGRECVLQSVDDLDQIDVHGYDRCVW